jgi:crossover junction endodeoxyribonuclease RuvC
MRIGIDPCISGAMALLDDNLSWIQLGLMPTMTLGKRKMVNTAALAKVLITWEAHSAGLQSQLTVYLERVSAMPGQGVSGMFNFGVSYGIVQGIQLIVS